MDDLEDLSRRAAQAQNGVDPRRVGPEPWFVGSNGRLAGVVITIVALLIAVRLVTSAWMVEEAWEWWSHHPPAVKRSPTVQVPAQVVAAPPALVPPPIESSPQVAQAVQGSEAEWITVDDYPAASQQAGEEGRTRIRWRIDADGRVRRCGTIESSGFTRLDNAACQAIIRRARYRPALDARGRALPMTKERAVVWRLPQE